MEPDNKDKPLPPIKTPSNDKINVGDNDKSGTKNASTGDAMLDEIAEPIMANQPDVQDHVVNQSNDQPIIDHTPKPPTDNFDPSIHSTGLDGKPVLNKNGSMRKKRGRKQKPDTPFNDPTRPVDQSDKINPQESIDAQSAIAGIGTAHLYMALTQSVGGDEWKRDATQTQVLETAFKDYFVATGKTDLPPGLTLGLILASDIGSRMTKPKTASRLSKIKKWGKASFSKLFNRAKKAKAARELDATRQAKRNQASAEQSRDDALSNEIADV